MDEEDKVDYYINGLRPEVGNMVRSFLRDSLTDNMSLAVRTEDALRTALQRPSPTRRVAEAATPMELGAIDARESRPIKLTDSERKKLLASGRCFRCREHGHLFRDCPTYK